MTTPATAPLPKISAPQPPSRGRWPSNALKRALEQSKTGLDSFGLRFGAVAWNEAATEAPVDLFEGLRLASAANAEATSSGVVSDEGLLTVPFGDWKVDATRPDGTTFACIQRLDAEAVNEMTKGWRGILQKVQLWLFKIPVYEGHPDRAQALNEDQKDSLLRGTVRTIGAEGEAMAIGVAWNDAGKAVRESYQGHSPHWLLRETGETHDGLPVMRPCLLVSIGLTNKPNITGSAININEEEEPNQENPKMNELIAKLRADLKLDAAMSDEDVLKRAVDHYGQIMDELFQAKSQLAEADRLKKEAEATAEKAKKDLAVAEGVAQTAQAEAAAANEALTAKAVAIVDSAIEAGRIPIADRQGWLDRFAADPLDAAAASANEQPKLKVDETAGAAVNSRAEAAPMDQFIGAVRAHMVAQKVPYQVAWNACQKTHAALWESIGKGK